MNEAEKIKSRKFCERCGVCCIKGGPTLHDEDLKLLEEGVLTYSHLYTLRKGEMVQEQVKGGLLPLEKEIVKIRGIGSHWTCLFYDDDVNSCTIYEKRPEECRTFNCWATDDLEAMYDKGRITRADIVAKGSALSEVIDTHEAEVAYADIEKLAFAFADGDQKAGQTLADKITWDAAFRSAFADKTEASEEEMIFLFGRPLHATIHQYELEVGKENDRYVVKKIQKD